MHCDLFTRQNFVLAGNIVHGRGTSIKMCSQSLLEKTKEMPY